MREELDDREARILGCLIEKELTTPDYYPLTLNAVTNACNQKSNRSPVVMYSESAVAESLQALREKGWVAEVEGAGSRSTKFRHWFPDKSGLNKKEMVALGLLMLRGPQTVGEIRGRSGRMYRFEGLDEVSETLNGLIGAEEPWVIKLARQAGRKENRFAHTLAGANLEDGETDADSAQIRGRLVPEYDDRIHALEIELSGLKDEVAGLKEELAKFRAQFE